MVQNYTCPPPMPNKKSSPQNFGLYQTYEKCIMNIINFLNEKNSTQQFILFKHQMCWTQMCWGKHLFHPKGWIIFILFNLYQQSKGVF